MPGGAVPRLGIEAVELVERGEVGILEFQRLRGRRDQDPQRLQQVHAASDHQFQHVVETLRIRTMHGNDRVELGDVEARRLPHLAARLRPAAIAFDGVDLAVVGEQAEGVRQRPARQGVGGEALVEHHRARGQVVALQVGKERGQLVRQDHALVADRVRGQRHHVEIAGALVRQRLAQALLGTAARQEQRQRESVVVLALAGIDEKLFDARQRVLRQLPADRIIDRQNTPSPQRGAGAGQFFFQATTA